MEISPENIRLLNQLAMFQLDCGRATAALPLLRLASRLAPGDRETHYLIATTYLQIGDTAQSARYMQLYERGASDQHTFASLLLKSLITLREGQAQEAREVFLQAVGKLRRAVAGS